MLDTGLQEANIPGRFQFLGRSVDPLCVRVGDKRRGEGEVPQLLWFASSTNLASICKLISPCLTQQEHWFSFWSSPFTHSLAYYSPVYQ